MLLSKLTKVNARGAKRLGRGGGSGKVSTPSAAAKRVRNPEVPFRSGSKAVNCL